MNDDWLDAFAPEDLDDPAWVAIDGAIQRTRLPRTRWRFLPMVVGCIGLAASALWFVGTPTNTPVPAPVVTASLRVVDVGLSRAPMRRVESVEFVPSVRLSTASAETAAPTPPAPTYAATTAPAVRPGLQMRPGSQAHLEGDTAVLTGGVLIYQHDATHEPGVRIVRFETPAVRARPVGTAFTAATAAGCVAVRVKKGEVWMEHLDGRPITALHPGDELVLLEVSNEIIWVSTRSISLDAIGDLLPKKLKKHSRSVVSVVASLRLAAREGLDEQRLPLSIGSLP